MGKDVSLVQVVTISLCYVMLCYIILLFNNIILSKKLIFFNIKCCIEKKLVYYEFSP
jgi:hypothetical protein